MGVVQNRWPTNAPIFSRRLHEHRTATADSNRPSGLSDGPGQLQVAPICWVRFFGWKKLWGLNMGKNLTKYAWQIMRMQTFDFIGVIEDFIDTELCL